MVQTEEQRVTFSAFKHGRLYQDCYSNCQFHIQFATSCIHGNLIFILNNAAFLHFLDTAIRISAQEGDNITILCTATDTILLETENTTRNSPPRKLSPSNVTCLTSSTCIYSFTLLNVTRNDAGVYICLNTSEAYYLTVTG